MSLVNTAHPSSRPAHTSSRARTQPGGWPSATSSPSSPPTRNVVMGVSSITQRVVAEHEGVEGEDETGHGGNGPRGGAADHQVAEQHQDNTESGVHPAHVEHQVHGRSTQAQQPDRGGVEEQAPGRVEEERLAEQRGQPTRGEHRCQVGVGELVDEQVVGPGKAGGPGGEGDDDHQAGQHPLHRDVPDRVAPVGARSSPGCADRSGRRGRRPLRRRLAQPWRGRARGRPREDDDRGSRRFRWGHPPEPRGRGGRHRTRMRGREPPVRDSRNRNSRNRDRWRRTVVPDARHGRLADPCATAR